jgi:hypothetical protein
MKSVNEGPLKKADKNKDDPAKPFPNAEKESAAEVNKPENDKVRNYMEGDDDVNGPDLDQGSKAEDGDTSVNAGVFK